VGCGDGDGWWETDYGLLVGCGVGDGWWGRALPGRSGPVDPGAGFDYAPQPLAITTFDRQNP
ncbi:MAG: hypothetical protein L0271_08085, partial [Gemmatimonadetes bacterium]|nr:hypothetical protein [Gemmatimonadota bacterium]